MEKALRKYFGKRGDRVVQDNLTCVKRGYSEMKEIPRRGHCMLERQPAIQPATPSAVIMLRAIAS